jgi:hypothetical protein
MSARDLRFGIARKDGRPGGSYWKMRVAADANDIYISETSTGGFAHVSLHASGRWHVKVGDPDRDKALRIDYEQPSPQLPNGTLALMLIAPASWGEASTRPDAQRAVKWFHPADFDESEIVFGVCISIDADRTDPTWPGQLPPDSSLLGRLTRSDGSMTCVVAKEQPGRHGRIEQPSPITQSEFEGLVHRIRAAPDPRMMLYGYNDRGVMLIRYGYVGHSRN